MDKTETVVGAFIKMRMEALASKRVHRENTKLSDALFDKDAGRNHRPLMVGFRWKNHYFINEDEASYSQVARELRRHDRPLHTTSYERLRVMRIYAKNIEFALNAYRRNETSWGMAEQLREALEFMNAAYEHFNLPDRHAIDKSLDRMLVNLYNELDLNYKYTDVFFSRSLIMPDDLFENWMDHLGITNFTRVHGEVFLTEGDAAIYKISDSTSSHVILEKKNV